MNTRVQSGVFGPRKSYIFPDYDIREGMITDRQKRQLTEAILSSWNESEEEKEEKLLMLPDLTESEATDYLLELTHWK